MSILEDEFMKYCLRYHGQESILNKIRVVSMDDETLSRVFDVSSHSEQKLRSKRRSKIIKIYAN